MKTETKVYYSNRTCRRGHDAPRYVSNNVCVECQRLINVGKELPAKQKIALDDVSIFHRTGLDCTRGHVDPPRYHSNSRCALCRRLKQEGRELPPKQDNKRILQDRARTSGHLYFDSSIECANGHGTVRYTANGRCPVCATSFFRERYRDDAGFRAERLAYSKVNARRFLGKKRERAREAYTADPARFLLVNALRQRRARYATPAWLNEVHLFQMRIFYIKAKRLTELTSIPHDVDHIVPLQGKTVCGLNVPWNLQVLTSEENRRKGDRLPEAGELVCRKLILSPLVSGSRRRTKPTTT